MAGTWNFKSSGDKIRSALLGKLGIKKVHLRRADESGHEEVGRVVEHLVGRPHLLDKALASGGIAATVDVSEMMGSAIHIHVDAEGRDVVIVVPVSEEEAESGVW